jgi:GGDEF domain-containing protein
MYHGNDYFKNRALEEIQRVKRYPSFVSLLFFDLSHINSDSDLENFESLDKFYLALKELIKNSVRETDLISNIYSGKIALLLVETPKNGAEVLSERLKKSIKYFLCNNTKSPLNWRVSARENSFPCSDKDESGFINVIQEIN